MSEDTKQADAASEDPAREAVERALLERSLGEVKWALPCLARKARQAHRTLSWERSHARLMRQAADNPQSSDPSYYTQENAARSERLHQEALANALAASEQLADCTWWADQVEQNLRRSR